MIPFNKSIFYKLTYYFFYILLLFDEYIPIGKNVRRCLGSCKKHNKYKITKIVFKPISPLRNEEKNYKDEIIIDFLDIVDIQNAWDKIKTNGITLKVGDTLCFHYKVPFVKNDNIEYEEYITPYVYPGNIVFPPYDLNYLQKNNDISPFRQGVLNAICNNKDYTNELIQYSGPLGNFYSDLPSRYGIKVSRNCIISDNDNSDLVITDNNGTDHTFSNNTYIRI